MNITCRFKHIIKLNNIKCISKLRIIKVRYSGGGSSCKCARSLICSTVCHIRTDENLQITYFMTKNMKFYSLGKSNEINVWYLV